MQRPGQRAIARRHRREQIGLRRGHDARREGRCIHAVIAHRDEIGVERRHLARVGLAVEHHRQRVGGMADGRIGRDGIAALRALHQRARDHRKCADDGGLMLQSGFGAQSGDGGAETVDDRQAARNAQQAPAAGQRRARGPRPGRRAPRPRVDRLAGPAAPQPGGDALEAGLAREVADPLAGDDQFAALAIDMAQHGFGGGNAVQPDRGFGKLHVHGRSPLLKAVKGRPSRQIDQS